MSKAGFRFMDSDLHMIELASLYETYLEPTFRDRAPRLQTSDASAIDTWLVDGQA